MMFSKISFLFKKKYTCPFCNCVSANFKPGGLKFNVLKQKKVIGGGYRKNVFCPYCASSDRERLVYLYIKIKNLIHLNMKLLHIAPEKNLQKKFQNSLIEYYSADLSSQLAKIKMDIQNIQFPSAYFDSIICNHVLEHVADDHRAMKELYRVLKPGGWAILQVPFSPLSESTLEDLTVIDPAERCELFGQKDHVRIYGKDYQNFLQNAGFLVSKRQLSSREVERFALNPNELLFFCKK